MARIWNGIPNFMDEYRGKDVAYDPSRDCFPIQVDDVALLSEYITGRLYFAIFRGSHRPQCTRLDHFFSTDDDFVYNPFNYDFGPLCLSSIIRYCCLVKSKLCCSELRNKRIIHYTSLENPHQRANATLLITAFAVLCLNRSPNEALLICNRHRAKGVPPLRPFRDASPSERSLHIRVRDCLSALRTARALGLFDPGDFDVLESEALGGDVSWVVPRRLLAFAGPTDEGGLRPHAYLDYFKASGVAAVVRLNRPEYDRAVFLRAGIRHHDLFFPDGTAPPRALARAFLRLCSATEGAVAVHCKAGLGRTGVLIASRLVHCYGMRAREAVAWVRLCRPGSIMSSQQEWLENNERFLMSKEPQRRPSSSPSEDVSSPSKVFPFGIYSIREKAGRALESAQGTSARARVRLLGKRPHGRPSTKGTTANPAGKTPN